MTTLPVIVLGAGGHARVLAEALLRSGVRVAGCVAPDVPKQLPPALPFLGDDGVVATFNPAKVMLVNGIGSVGRSDKRKAIFLRFRASGYCFATVVHPSAVLATDVHLAEGAQVMAGVVIQPGCRLDENVIINTGALLDHDCEIGAHTHLAPGAVLSGDVRIGAEVFVGTGARVIQGIAIGTGAVVGAGAVVVRDVADDAVVVGVPARRLAKPAN